MDPSLPIATLREVSDAFRYPFVFVTLSGSHLYGFPSADSDFDIRGAHLLPGSAFWGLGTPVETEEAKQDTEAGLVELVSHDLRKFARLLLKRNGYVLEQLTSPLVIRSSSLHAHLVSLVPSLLTRNHYHHYRGFYHTERKEYERINPRSIKKLLYCYRVLMTGIVLLREGIVEANLPRLNERFQRARLSGLIELKSAGEASTIPDDPAYARELDALEAELDRAFGESALPEAPGARDEVERLVIGARERGEAANAA